MNKTKVFWIHLIDVVTMNCIWTFSLLLCSKPTPYSCNEVIIMFRKVCFKSQKSQKEIGDGVDSFFCSQTLDLDLVAKQTNKNRKKKPFQSNQFQEYALIIKYGKLPLVVLKYVNKNCIWFVCIQIRMKK